LRAYSHRLSWNFTSNSFSVLVQQKRDAGVPLLDLTISNPTQAFAEYPHEEIRRAFANIADFTYRPDPFGSKEARCIIAALYAEQKIPISPDQLVLTASSSEAYALLFKLLCDPEDEVLVPAPSYPLFDFLARLESIRIVPYRLRYDGIWCIDFANLSERTSSHTRAIVIVNPNNPTGSFMKEYEKHELFELARQHDLPIISDEVFMNYSLGSTTKRVTTLTNSDTVLSFSLNGLSKAAGMPQMKLGWIAINGPTEEREIARERLEILLDTYLSVNTPVQNALRGLLRIGSSIYRQIAQRTRRNLDALDEIVNNSPVHRLHTEGGWSAIIRLPHTGTEDTWVTRLVQQEAVVVQPGYLFDMESEPFVVVSLITPPEVFDEGIRRLRALASRS
jgi:alanine-synthesizing transaminase